MQLEERLAREIRAARHERETGDAHSDEEIEAVAQQAAAIENEQTRLGARLRWLEERQPIAGRPPAVKKRTRKTDR